MLGLKKGEVTLKKHNFLWKYAYKLESIKIKKALKNNNFEIEHIGSTAIKHCYAKPIIDIMIAVEKLEDGKNLLIGLEKIGYTYVVDKGFGVRYFLKKVVKGKTKFHIHIVEKNSRLWQNQHYFKKYLNQNKELAEKYSILKINLAKIFKNERSEYTLEKAPFIKKILTLAFKEYDVVPGEKDNVVF